MTLNATQRHQLAKSATLQRDVAYKMTCFVLPASAASPVDFAVDDPEVQQSKRPRQTLQFRPLSARNYRQRIYRLFAFATPAWTKLNTAGVYAAAEELWVSQTVFVLEDDTDISRLVQYHVEKAGFTVRAFEAGRNVVSEAERTPPALFLLDVMVPDGDGMDVCRRLRAHPTLSSLPIIFLTARAAESDRVRGLELGADDYITKPFGTRELVARIRAVLRRSEPKGEKVEAGVLHIEDLDIDSAAMQLRVKGELVVMTATEFRLLDYLARHPGRMFSRDHLLDAVWGDARFVTPRSVDVYVRRIREKIEADPETPRYLKTMRGAGYRFEIPKAGMVVSGPAAMNELSQ